MLHRREWELDPRLRQLLSSISPQIINTEIKAQLRKITEVITAWWLLGTLMKSFMQFHSFGASLSGIDLGPAQAGCFLPAPGAQDLPLPNPFHLLIQVTVTGKSHGGSGPFLGLWQALPEIREASEAPEPVSDPWARGRPLCSI